jgi:hypothetical protein
MHGRILQNLSSLSAKILKAVYFPSSSILEATVGQHPSQIWRSIMQGNDAMVQGLVRRIGTGEDTQAWNQNWIPRDFMLRATTCKKMNPPVRVSAFIDTQYVSWNHIALEEFFLPMDVKQICKIPLGTHRQADSWAWHYERSGIFSVRSMYRLLVHTKRRREDWLDNRPAASNQAGEEKLWKKMWTVKCHLSCESSSGTSHISLSRQEMSDIIGTWLTRVNAQFAERKTPGGILL